MSTVNLEPRASVPAPVYTDSAHHITAADASHLVYDGKKVRLFTDFAAEVHEQAKSKSDRLTPEAVARIGSDIKLPNGVGFTPHGLESLASHTRITPRTVTNLLEQGYEDVVVQVLNDQLNQREERYWEGVTAQRLRGRNPKGEARSFLLRQRLDEQGNPVVRAVVSERYGVIDNHHVLEFIQAALPLEFSENAVTHKPFNDGDDLLFNLFLPDHNEKTGLFFGLHVRNSEVRRAKFTIDSFLFRSYCTNGCIWGRTSKVNVLDQKHVGKLDLDAIRERVGTVVQNVLRDGKLFRQQFVQAQDVRLSASPKQLVAHLAKRTGLTVEQGQAWWSGYQKEPAESAGDLNAQHLVNGLTRGAQQFEGEARYQLEAVAGSLLSPSLAASLEAQVAHWDRFDAAARTLTDQEVARFVATLVAA